MEARFCKGRPFSLREERHALRGGSGERQCHIEDSFFLFFEGFGRIKDFFFFGMGSGL